MEKKRGTTYTIGVGILILVAVGFFITPLTGTLVSQRASITFGRYGNREIAYIPGNYFAQQVDRAGATLRQGDAFAVQLVWRQAFDATIAHTALLREAERAATDISERTLDRQIAQHPNFRGVDGFDVEAYRALTTQQRARFRALQRELYVRERYIDDFGTGALTPTQEVAQAQQSALEERRIDFTVVASAEITDAHIAQYVADNAGQFERLRLAVIESEDTLRGARRLRASIADDGSNFYEKRSEVESTEALSVESESEWLFFSELSERYPTARAEDVEQLRTLPLRRVSPLISFTEHEQERHAIFLVEERQSYEATPPEELSSYARAYIETRAPTFQQDLLRAAMAERQELVAAALDNVAANKSISLVDIGATNGFAVERSDYFPLNYGNVDLYPAVASDDEGYLDGLERNRDFLTSIFTATEGEVSGPIEHRGNLILFQVRDVRPVDPDEIGDFADFYQQQLARYTEDSLDSSLVQRDRIFDNFDQTYQEFIATP